MVRKMRGKVRSTNQFDVYRQLLILVTQYNFMFNKWFRFQCIFTFFIVKKQRIPYPDMPITVIMMGIDQEKGEGESEVLGVINGDRFPLWSKLGISDPNLIEQSLWCVHFPAVTIREINHLKSINCAISDSNTNLSISNTGSSYFVRKWKASRRFRNKGEKFPRLVRSLVPPFPSVFRIASQRFSTPRSLPWPCSERQSWRTRYREIV